VRKVEEEEEGKHDGEKEGWKEGEGRLIERVRVVKVRGERRVDQENRVEHDRALPCYTIKT
jgi:hypothetical protein